VEVENMKKWKKNSVIAIGALAALLSSASFSMAVKGTCTLTKVTVTEYVTDVSSNYAVYATCTPTGESAANAETYYYIAKSEHTEGYYATALTALSLKQPVDMSVGAWSPGSLINELSLTAAN